MLYKYIKCQLIFNKLLLSDIDVPYNFKTNLKTKLLFIYDK